MQEKFAKYNGMIEKSMSKFGFALRRKKDVLTKIIPQQKIVGLHDTCSLSKPLCSHPLLFIIKLIALLLFFKYQQLILLLVLLYASNYISCCPNCVQTLDFTFFFALKQFIKPFSPSHFDCFKIPFP